MITPIVKWIKENRVGLYLGGAVGFIFSRIMFLGDNETGRNAIARSGIESMDISGPLDSLLGNISPEMLLFVKLSFVTVILFAIIGGITDSMVK